MPSRTALVSELRAVKKSLVTFGQTGEWGFALSLSGECVAGIIAVRKNPFVRIRRVEVGRVETTEAPGSVGRKREHQRASPPGFKSLLMIYFSVTIPGLAKLVSSVEGLTGTTRWPLLTVGRTNHTGSLFRAVGNRPNPCISLTTRPVK